MTDTQLILEEIKLLREAVEDCRSAISKRNPPRKKANPTKEEVLSYAAKRGRSDIGEKFWDYYNETKWHDNQNKPIYNWKSKFLYWERSNEPPTTTRTLWQ